MIISPRNLYLKQKQIFQLITQSGEDLAYSQAGTTENTPNPGNLWWESGHQSPDIEPWETLQLSLQASSVVELLGDQKESNNDR